MKSMLLLVIFSISSIGTFAQEGPKIQNLTDEQKALLEENKSIREVNREEFKATFTEEQLAILQNEELNRREKMEAIQATLTEEQIALREEHKTINQSNMEAFRETLTEEQIARIENRKDRRERRNGEMGENRPGNGLRNVFHESLSEEQLAIVQNTELTREEKHEALMETLTTEQKAQFDAMQAQRENGQRQRGPRGPK